MLQTAIERQDHRREFLKKMARGVLGTGVAVGTGMSSISAWTGSDTNSILNQARAADGDQLKIVKVEPFILRMRRNAKGEQTGMAYMCCRVETEEGLVGWGEGTNFPGVATIATELEVIKPFVLNQSAWDIEKIWNLIYRGRAAMHGSAVQSAISCIDIALWDIVGQKLGVPCYKLLGGKVNERLKIYVSNRWGDIPRTADAYKKRTKELIAEGAIAGKWDPLFDVPYTPNMSGNYSTATGGKPYIFNREISLREIREIAEMVRGVREASPDFEICVEAHAKLTVGGAVRLAKAIEPYSPMFYEEPVPPENVDAMIEVQRATSIPVAAGERLKSRMQARDVIERNAVRLYQPDAARCGGISEFRKIATMAEAHYIPIAPHSPNGPICMAAHIHLATAMPNFAILEEGTQDVALNTRLFGRWQESHAYFTPFEAPGLGLKIADDFVRDHKVPLEKS